MSGTHDTGEARLGKYELRGTLGRGAMGTVFDGWDPAIHRRVAIKTVRLADAEDEEAAEGLARFKREAQAAGRLSHPSIVGVFDYGETASVAYIVMEFVEGRSLKSIIDQERRLPPPEAVEIMTQVLAGLAYSHARGVIHRDIKPANIMVTGEGQVKIADFGIARIESSSMTSVGMMMGTPAYMPPEQFLGEPVDARSDIYAAGVMLFHLLTGERPYEGSMSSIMHRVLNAEVPPRASSRAAVPTVFDAVIARAMARAPAERFANAAQFSAALTAALEAPVPAQDEDATMMARLPAASQEPTGAPAPVVAAAAGARRSMQPAMLGGGVVALVLLAAGVLWLVRAPPSKTVAASPLPSPAALALPPPALAVVQHTDTPTPPTPPKPDMRAMREALAGLDCTALLVAAPSADGAVGVSGLSGQGEPDRLARAAVGRLSGAAPVTWSAVPMPAIYCAALDVLRVAHDPAMSITLNGQAGRTTLRDEDLIAPTVSMPRYAARLRVDDLSNDGSLAHLLPSLGRVAPAQQPGTVVALTGKEDSVAIGPPFGRDLVIAVASSQLLFAHPRSDKETMAHYLSDLRNAVAAARTRGVTVSAAAIVVDTVPK